MKTSLVTILFFGGFGIAFILESGCNQNKLTPALVEAKDLQCTITADPECKLGDVPDISVSITNRSGTDFYLVGSLDASDSRERFPHCYFEVIGPDGASAVPKPNDWCDYINALRPQDFIYVHRGQSFDPYQKTDGGFFSAWQLSPDTFSTPGEYRIRFFYSSNDNSLDQWNGIGGQSVEQKRRLMELLEQVPKLLLASNTLTITVIDTN